MHFSRLVLLCLACVGHVVIVRALLNWMYRFSLKELLWRSVVLLHALAAAVGPVLIVVLIGGGSSRWLFGGDWMSIPDGWQAYLVLCWISLGVGLAVSTINRLRRPPAVQLSNHMRTIDIARQLGFRPAAGGFPALLARLPGNDLYRIDLVERQIALPRLPAEWDGLSILHFSDLHFNGTPTLEFFERAADAANDLAPDLVAFTGDLLDDRTLVSWLPSTLGKLHAPLGRYFILGNHDARTNAPASRRAMVDLGWTDLGSKFVVAPVRGRQLLIAGTEVPWIGRHPDLSAGPAADLRLLLSHTPHCLPWAQQQSFDLMLAGHLHGGQVRLPLVGAVIGGRLNSGLFDVPPTLLHVSRGLGELTPLRWMCRPEMTKLVLRRPVELQPSPPFVR